MECFVFAKFCHRMLGKHSSNELHFPTLKFFEIGFPTWGPSWPWTYDPRCLCCPRDDIIGRCHEAQQRSLMTENVYVSTVISCKLLHRADMNNFSLDWWKYSPDYRRHLKKKPDRISKYLAFCLCIPAACNAAWTANFAKVNPRLYLRFLYDFKKNIRMGWQNPTGMATWQKKIISGFWIASFFFFLTHLCKQL